MGAYYEYQISYNPVPWKGRTICLPTLGGMKFLETFYARTGNTLFLLDLLQEYGEAIVNTVCDYDKKGTFVYGVPYATHDTLNKVERAMANSIKEMDEEGVYSPYAISQRKLGDFSYRSPDAFLKDGSGWRRFRCERT